MTRQLQIDAVCVQFEQELRGGKWPRIEAFLQGHDEPLRSQLLRHLLQIELEYRVEQGERLEIGDFLDRFPHDQSLIHIVQGELSRPSRAPETEFLGNSPSANKSGDSALSRSDSSLHGRFLPGTKIANRYRIVSLLGKGGMGEVYRADDLRLGHTVALKFLPKKLARDPERLERFQAEVRLTRQISHPNVCRVYDMDEVDGQQFLSMEFIDGEDLRILLRRIGRLPKDKGIQIAQQLCAGLAAAHDKGVLHRDLKPANIMIDGHGQVRITDFGLAKLASDNQDTEFAGTPAYMAPEQLRHGETTIQSDLYSLGLILHEVFTGEAVHKAGSIPELIKQHEDSAPSQPSSVVDDMDPVVERVILRCLEKQPNERPKSAHAVANSLPGGDPIAAALAAGETPSPAMIAAAGGVGGLDPRVGAALFAAVLVGLTAVFWFSQYSDINRIGESRHPQAIVEVAREIIRTFGYTDPPLDEAWGFMDNRDYTDYLNASDDASALVANLSTEQPPPTEFWYRHSPVYLEPQSAFNEFDIENRYFATPHNPPLLRSGMILVRLDMRGRLYEFRAVPSQRIESHTSQPEMDWLELLEADSKELLGFSLASLKPSEPKWNSPFNCDAQQAWEGTYPNGLPIRVETASYRGRPIYLHVIGEWTRAERDDGHWPTGSAAWEAFTIASLLWVILMAAAAILALGYYQAGRTDRRGALRLSVFVFLGIMLMWLLRGTHVPTIHAEINQLTLALASSLFTAAQMWLFYSAMEPSVRRYWPRVFISWSRVLNGRFRDPLVGQHILVGVVVGIGMWLYERLQQNVIVRLDASTGEEFSYVLYLPSLLGGANSLAGMIEKLFVGICFWLFILLLLLILRLIVRSHRLAAVCLVLIGVLVSTSFYPPDSTVTLRIVTPITTAVLVAILIAVLIRFGLLAMVICGFCHGLLYWPITTDMSAWYFETGLSAVLVVLAIAGYGFYTSLGKKRALSAG